MHLFIWVVDVAGPKTKSSVLNKVRFDIQLKVLVPIYTKSGQPSLYMQKGDC